jgi:hypothetical protein
VINNLAADSPGSTIYVVKTTDDMSIYLRTFDLPGNTSSITLPPTVQDEIAKVVTHPIIWFDQVEDAYNAAIEGSEIVYLGNIYASGKGSISVGGGIDYYGKVDKRVIYTLTGSGREWTITGTRWASGSTTSTPPNRSHQVLALLPAQFQGVISLFL